MPKFGICLWRAKNHFLYEEVYSCPIKDSQHSESKFLRKQFIRRQSGQWTYLVSMLNKQTYGLQFDSEHLIKKTVPLGLEREI